MLYLYPRPVFIWKFCYKLLSIETLTFVQIFDQKFVFFTERLDTGSKFALAYFVVWFERRKAKLIKKANLHEN